MPDNSHEFIHLDCPRCGAPLQMEGEVLTCQYCGAKLILKRTATTRQNAPVGQNRGTVVNGFPLSPFSYYDPQSSMEVFSLLVPQGWRINGGVTWVPERPAAPAQIGLKLDNPNGLEAFEAYPNLYFNWTNNPLIQMTKPAGSLYFGCEVRQPVAAREAMRQYVLPRYRKIQGLAIVDEGPALELRQVANHNQPAPMQGMQYSNDSVRVRLHYAQNNQMIAEEMSGVVEYTRIMVPGLMGGMDNINWSIGYLTSFRASRERLESYADLYRAIFASVKLNPAWTALVQQVTQGLTHNTIRQINQIGALSRQISRNFNEMSDMNMKGWQERSAASERVSEQFSQTLRDVDPYYDPNSGQNVELPSGYTQAWSTPLGEYLLSDDPNFNPNIGSNQNWTPLTPPGQ